MDNLILLPEEYYYGVKNLENSIEIIKIINNIYIKISNICEENGIVILEDLSINKMYNDLNNLLTKLNTIKQIMINMDPSISALYDELDGNDNYINYEDIEKNEIFIDLLKGNNHDTGANVVVNGESIFKELNNPNKVNELLDNLKGNNNDTGSIKSLDAVSIMSGEM